MNNNKVLILDGIGGVPLGLEMQESFQQLGIPCSHYNCAKLPKIPFYRYRSAVAKLFNKAERGEEFYHLPQLDTSHIAELLVREAPTAILVIGFIYKFIQPKRLAQLARERSIPLYLYDTDSCNLYGKRREFIFFLNNELPFYSHIFSFSQVTTTFFRDTRGLPASYFPFGAKPLPAATSDIQHHDVVFIGSGDLRRIFVLEHIAERVRIYGNRWERNYPLISNTLRSHIRDVPIWGEALRQVLQDSRIVLNVTRSDFYAAETGVNLRIFEALAAGCFLLTDYCEEVAELFEIGVEIEAFRSSQEMVEKVDYYLRNPEQRMAIARRGHQKFLAHYTWASRVDEMSKKMALLSDNSPTVTTSR